MGRLDMAAVSLHIAYREGASVEELARGWLGDDRPEQIERVRAVLRDGAFLREAASGSLPDKALPDTGWHEGVLS
jgi:hypothetical protein